MRKKYANKSDLRYWKNRIFMPKGAASWHVELQARGERHKLSLQTPNRDAAASAGNVASIPPIVFSSAA